MSGRWLLIGRYRHTGGLAFYRCYALQTVPLPVLVKVAGTRRRIEEAFQTSKGLTGPDQHQVRTWTWWVPVEQPGPARVRVSRGGDCD